MSSIYNKAMVKIVEWCCLNFGLKHQCYDQGQAISCVIEQKPSASIRIYNLCNATPIPKKFAQGHVYHSAFNKSVNIWELQRPAAGLLWEECCLIWILTSHQSFVSFAVFSWLIRLNLLAGRSVQLSCLNPCCCNRCSMQFCIALLKYTSSSLKNTSEWEYMLL